MALALGGFGAARLAPSPSAKVCAPEGVRSAGSSAHARGGGVRAMVQQQTFQGASATYAKEMERLSAKESLLLAFKDSGGFESLVSGKTTEMQRIDVNERIVGLERLNPTPRPTTSPFLEGRWNFEWFSAGSPGLLAAKLLFERFPGTLVNLVGLNMLIKDSYSKVTAHTKLLNSVVSLMLDPHGGRTAQIRASPCHFWRAPDRPSPSSTSDLEKHVGIPAASILVLPATSVSPPPLSPHAALNVEFRPLANLIKGNFLLTTKLSVEGPIRLKEEYVEGVFETPTISDESIPEQLKGPLGQAADSLQQLPVPIRDAFANGLRIPLSGTFQRLFMISYLDEEILIIRDTSGSPDVLMRLEGLPDPLGADPITEYES